MLSERVYRALSAFVDGEANPRLRRAVARLVERSDEARFLLDQLRQDRERLRALPKQQLGPDFADGVLKVIAARGIKILKTRPAVEPLTRPRFRVPTWVGMAAAASILLVVGAVAFSFFAQAFQTVNSAQPIARQGTEPTGSEAKPPQGDSPPKPPEDNQPPSDPPGSENPPVLPGTNVAQEPNDQPNIMIDTSPDPITGPMPSRDLFGPHTADVTLPVVQKLTELSPTELRVELQKDTSFRVELPSRETARAFERLQSAFKAQGINLLVDQDVQAWLKKPSLHTDFVVFTEDLTAEEFIKFLEQVAADDKKAEGKKKGDAAFGGVVLFRLDKDDRKSLADLLGIDAKQVQNTRPTTPGHDPQTPLSDVTEKQVVSSLTGQGGTPRGSESPKVTGKPRNSHALVLPFNPVRVRPNSVQVKAFLEGRKTPRPGTLQLLIVVREGRG